MEPPSLDRAYRFLSADLRLEAELAGERIIVRRRRNVPRRGIFRMLIPQVTAKVRRTPDGFRLALRPDGLGVFMVIVMIGGVIVELTMDRRRYPREYPPAFVYGLAAFYLVLFVLEVARTRSVVHAALERLRLSDAF